MAKIGNFEMDFLQKASTKIYSDACFSSISLYYINDLPPNKIYVCVSRWYFKVKNAVQTSS